MMPNLLVTVLGSLSLSAMSKNVGPKFGSSVYTDHLDIKQKCNPRIVFWYVFQFAVESEVDVTEVGRLSFWTSTTF